jgi:hypothetical protein
MFSKQPGSPLARRERNAQGPTRRQSRRVYRRTGCDSVPQARSALTAFPRDPFATELYQTLLSVRYAQSRSQLYVYYVGLLFIIIIIITLLSY